MPRYRCISTLFLTLAALAIGSVFSSSALADGWVSFGIVSPTSVNSQESGAAIDSSGNMVVVWNDEDSDQVVAATRLAGGNFGAPQVLGAGSNPAGSEPSIGVSSAGEFVVMWRDFATFRYATKSSAAAAFGTVDTVPSTDPDSDPLLAVDPTGRAFAFWMDDTLGGLSYSVRQPGGAFGNPSVIAGTAAVTDFDAAAANGGAYATWDDAGSIAGAPISAGGLQGAVNNAVDGGSGGSIPSVGMDSSGNPSIGYANTATNDVNVVRIVNGSPGTPKALTGTNVSPAAIQTTVTAAGSSHTIWSNTSNPADLVAQARRLTAGGTLGTFQSPLSAANANASVLDAVGNPDGSVLALWRSAAAQTVQAVAAGDSQPFGAATTLGAAQAITRGSTAIASNGNGVATWSSGAATDQVLVAGYDRTGPSLGSLGVPSSVQQLKSASFSSSPSDVFFLNGPTSWNFGDGKSASGNAVTHVYSSPGTYTVTASVSDTAGNTTSAKRTVKVTAGPAAVASVVSKALRMQRNGRITVRLRCPQDAVATCRGTVYLKSAGKVSISRRKVLTVGQTSYSLKQNRSADVRVKAKISARRYINRKRHLRIRASVTGRDGFGKTVVKRKTLTLRR